jgi:2-polyprenyl-3-methyl-5-hydroxy-6-metoxy-1,4-benzoquinol methylase
MQWARDAYYLVGFDREFPGKTRVAAAVQHWEERQQGKGDSPRPQADWDAQYAAGDWAYLGRLEQTSRYGAIVAYLTVLAPQGAVLDVGCGEGVLFQRLRRSGYGRYVGIDLSAVAIAARAKDEDARTTFAQADAERYQPAGLFDAIVFNESLYYFHEPLATLRRYMQALRPGGVAIVSLHTASPRARVITAQVRNHAHVISETTTHQDGKAWVCLVVDQVM